MAGVLSESVLGPAEAARLLRRLPQVVTRRVRQGDHGHRLEVIDRGGDWLTSVEAVYYFAHRPGAKHRGRAAALLGGAWRRLVAHAGAGRW
jgi:hypothetical protein